MKLRPRRRELSSQTNEERLEDATRDHRSGRICVTDAGSWRREDSMAINKKGGLWLQRTRAQN